MPTIALKVQQDGQWQGWSAIVGATFGYQAVDDSDGVTHDGDTSYLTLPRLQLPAGQVSFPLFLQAEGLIPVSITLNVVARGGTPVHPDIRIGFHRAGVVAFGGAMFTPPAGTFTLAQRTFSTNPITGGPWSALDLVGLEACIQSQDGVLGNNDLTLVSGSMDYGPTTNVYRNIPWAQPI